MQARELVKQIDMILIRLTEGAKTTLENTQQPFLSLFFNAYRTEEKHLTGMLDEVERKLRVDFNQFENAWALRSYYDAIHDGVFDQIQTLSGEPSLIENPDKTLVAYCIKHKIKLMNYKTQLSIYLDYINAYSVLAIIKYCLRDFTETDSATHFEEIILALNETYQQIIQGPQEIKKFNIVRAMHGLNLMCDRLSDVLNKKGYRVAPWKIKEEGLQTRNDKTADSIEKWLNCLPTELAKPVSNGHGSNPGYLYFNTNYDRISYLAKEERERFDNGKLISRLHKSQLKALRIDDVLARIDKKFTRRLQKLVDLKKLIFGSSRHLAAHEKLALPVANRLEEVQNRIQFICDLLERENDCVERGVQFIGSLSLCDSLTFEDRKQIRFFSNNLVNFLLNYKYRFELLVEFHENESAMSVEKLKRLELDAMLNSHIETVNDFWKQSKQQVALIADQYIRISEDVLPIYSLSTNIWQHLIYALISGLLIGAIMAVIAYCLLLLPLISVALYFVAGFLIGAAIGGGISVLIDYLQTTRLPEIDRDKACMRFGPLPNEADLRTHIITEDPFEFEMETLDTETDAPGKEAFSDSSFAFFTKPSLSTNESRDYLHNSTLSKAEEGQSNAFLLVK